MCKRLLGENHPHIATSLNGLALLYGTQGKYAEAESLSQQALIIYQQTLGDQHAHTRNALLLVKSLRVQIILHCNTQTLFNILQALVQQAEIPFLSTEVALMMLEELENHPNVASFLNNLADLYCSQGRYEEADPLYLQALELRRRLLGNNHPDVAYSLRSLADLYNSQGRYEEAEPFYLKALELFKRLLGENHPDVATSLNNLASLYDSQGRYEKAEPLNLKALELFKRLLGENHPDVATSLNNLAALYESQGRYAEAEPLYAKALQIFEQSLGIAHPNTMTIRGNYAICLRRGR